MSETTIPFVCYYCGQATVIADNVLPRFEEGNGFECINEEACKRRQKRDQINVVKMFSMMSIVKTYGLMNIILSVFIALCTIFMIGVIFMGLAFLFGF